MHLLKKIGFFILFFSLPLVAALKGKAIVVSLILLFLLCDGPTVLMILAKRALNFFQKPIKPIHKTLLFLLF